MYLEALEEFPSNEIVLKTKKGEAEFQKADVFKRIIWYSYIDDASMLAIPLDKVKAIIQMNNKGKQPEKLEDFAVTMEQKTEYSNGVDEAALSRFDEELENDNP
jgi:hypothetical protein